MASIAIGLQALEGAREFQIRLDPDHLGRVDVKLTIAEDGRVAASLTADRVDTLALLQRDARTLERAFDQAGDKQLLRLMCACLQRAVNFARRQGPDVAGNQARAKVAVGLQFTGRAADDCGMTGQINGIGDDSRGGIGL
ncbi:MAG: flagellar hook-length control protein FliK [Rhizobiales bacterium]|nr:flagellar hook-length control protein FliK [Hyphomicrobiales bacterium]